MARLAYLIGIIGLSSMVLLAISSACVVIVLQLIRAKSIVDVAGPLVVIAAVFFAALAVIGMSCDGDRR